MPDGRSANFSTLTYQNVSHSEAKLFPFALLKVHFKYFV
jgi:hypothetical protein